VLQVVDPSAVKGEAPVQVLAVAGQGRWSVAASDSEGRISLSSLPGSVDRLTLISVDGRVVDLPLPIEGTGPRRVVLPPRASFEGRVREVHGDGGVEPIPGALVWDPADQGNWTPVARDGGYRLLNVETDRKDSSGLATLLSAEAPGYRRLDQEFTLAPQPHRKPGEPEGTLIYRDLDFWLSSAEDLVAVRGRILDPSGEPVSGAEVALCGATHPWSEEEVAQALAGLEPPEPDSNHGESDAEGVFLLGARAGWYNLVITHPQMAPEIVPEISVPAGPGPHELGSFSLGGGFPVAGLVTDVEGVPLGGVAVEVVYPARRGGETLYAPDRRRAPETTDATGDFHFVHLPDVDLALRLEKPGFVNVTVPVRLPVERTLRVTLERTAEISGRVLDDSREPIAGASVALVRSESSLRRMREPEPEVQEMGIADSRGRFQISGVPPGVWKLEVRAKDYAPGSADRVEVAEGESLDDIEIVLRRGARLTGRVVTVDGSGVPDARVRAAGQNTVTGEDGRFLFSDRISAGPFEIKAEHPDFGLAEELVTLSPGDDAEEVELVLEPGWIVAGKVIDSEGRGLPAALVTLRSHDQAPSSFAQTASDGSFHFRNVQPGRYSIVARKFRDTLLEGELEVVLNDKSVQNLELILQSGGWIRGIVRGLTAEELRRVTVMCVASDRPDGCRLHVNELGKFQTGELPLGEWTVVASLAGSDRSVGERVRITSEDREASVELQFESRPPLSGQVLLNGKPLINAEVRVLTGKSTLGLARTDWQGVFSFEEVSGGTGLEVVPPGQDFGVEVLLPGPPDGAPLDLRIETGSLAGTVLDSAGAPLAFAELVLVPLDQAETGFAHASEPRFLTSDAEGTFYLTRVPVGHYQLELTRGSPEASTMIEVAASRTTMTRLVDIP
jgi:hypothetical protein